MDTLENKKFVSSADTSVERIIYFISNACLAVCIIAAVVIFANWYVDREAPMTDLIYVGALLLGSVFSWAFTMLFLKVVNLLRHIYNRLDDSVLKIDNETPEASEEE